MQRHTRVSQETDRGAVWTGDVTEVSAEGVDKAGWAAEDWLVWIVPAGSGVQGPSPVVWNLPRVEWAGGRWPRGWEPVEEVRATGSGSAGLHREACSQVSCSLSLGPSYRGGAGPAGSPRPDVRVFSTEARAVAGHGGEGRAALRSGVIRQQWAGRWPRRGGGSQCEACKALLRGMCP